MDNNALLFFKDYDAIRRVLTQRQRRQNEAKVISITASLQIKSCRYVNAFIRR